MNTLSPVAIGQAEQFPVPGISKEWLILWDEIQIWYGDIKKKEAANQFLKRMQDNFKLQLINHE